MQEPLAHKRRRVDELLEMLALMGCANSYIGDSLARGISGGQVLACGCFPCSKQRACPALCKCCRGRCCRHLLLPGSHGAVLSCIRLTIGRVTWREG